MSCSRTARLALCALLFLLALSAGALADVQILTADSITATRGITSPSSAYGSFDGLTAYTTNVYSASGDTVTMTLSNYTAVGTIMVVNYTIRMNTSGAWNNDNIQIQYSNDGTTWFTSATVTPPATLTYYGNYTVTSTFSTPAALNGSMVRLLYTRNGPQDNMRSGIDGVMMYVTYAPPPTVALTSPPTDTFVTWSNVSFNFTPSSLISFRNCSLYINGTLNTTNQTPITPNANNSIYVNLTDGDYYWNVTCYDTSNFSATAGAQRVVKVDTKPPNVTLTWPQNGTISAATFNRFNFTVADATTIASCILVVDDVERNSLTSPAKDVNVTTNATLTIGDHQWYVNCTDAHGFTGQSGRYNISVQVTTPTVLSDKGQYDIGETVLFSGSNWQAGANVSINITLPNGTVENKTALVNASGKINSSLFLNYSYPAGSYAVFAYQLNDSEFNASTSFTVLVRLVNITPSQNEYMQGEEVTLVGLGFSPLSFVNITVKHGGGANNTTVVTDALGSFTYRYNLSYTESLTQHNVTGVDLTFRNLNATAAFNVTARVPTLSTNKSSYVANESVGVLGRFFSSFATINIEIYNTLTGRLGNGFPATVTANATGNFNYTWPVNHTCSGNYTIRAEDQSTPGLKANTTFLIANSLSQSLQSVTDGITANRVSPSLSNVITSDAQRQPVGLANPPNDGYLQFTFHPNIPQNATSIRANVTIQHVRTTNKIDTFQMYLLQGTTLTTLAGTGCSGTPPSAEGYTTCDFSSSVPNASTANNITVRVNYTSSGNGDAQVNLAYLNISWVGDPYGCFNFGDIAQPPIVTDVSAPAIPIVLNAGATKTVECNFTVSDVNGAADITGANLTVYAVPSTSFSGVTNGSKYDNSTCEVVSSDGSSKGYRCTVDLLYYATNGTWTCNATGISADGVASATSSFEVDPLYAINISETLLDFGNLSTGEISANITQNVTNIGNLPVNISAYGYGGTPGDGNAFSCATESIPIAQMRFAGNISATYPEKEPLSGSWQQLRLAIDKQAVPNVVRMNSTYWQVQIPDMMSDTGDCNGVIVFQGDAS